MRLRDEHGAPRQLQVQRRRAGPAGRTGGTGTSRRAPAAARGSRWRAAAERAGRGSGRARSRARSAAPISAATAVAISATWSVNQMTLSRYGFPWKMSDTAQAQLLPQKAHAQPRPEAQADPAGALLEQRERSDQHEDQREQHDPDRERLRDVVGVVDLRDDRARQRLVVALDVAADDDHRRRPPTASRRAPRSPPRSRRSWPRAGPAATSCARPAPSARACASSPGGSPWIAAASARRCRAARGSSARRTRARSVNSIRSEPNAPLRQQQQQHGDADEHRRQREARVGEDVQRAPAAEAPQSERQRRSAGRSRARSAVETSATRIVTQVTPRMYARSRSQISGNAARSCSQR